MRRLFRHRFRRTTLWLVLFIDILAGLGLSRTGPGLGVTAVLAMLPFLLIGLRRQRLSTLILIVIFGLACGWWRGAIYTQRLSAYNSFYYRKVTITARAMNDAIYGKGKQLTFDANNLTVEGSRLTGK